MRPGPTARNRGLASLQTALLASLLTAWAIPVAAADLALVVAEWRAGALGREAAGLLAWVAGPTQELRLDVLAPGEGGGLPPAGEAADRCDALLWRQGRGWTFVAGAAGEPGLLEPWDREWRPAPAGLADLARAVAAARPGQRGRLVVAEAVGSTAEAGMTPTAVPGLRRGLVRRGRGGGGPGERVSVDATTAGLVQIRSSRRPGALVVHPVVSLRVAADPASVFAPWWPLGEVLPGLPELTPAAGTPDPDGR
ncbi:MAG: hypothetical protein IPK64_09860 [bacterium]|nr:hypothetical protein [bacterium]